MKATVVVLLTLLAAAGTAAGQERPREAAVAQQPITPPPAGAPAADPWRASGLPPGGAGWGEPAAPRRPPPRPNRPRRPNPYAPTGETRPEDALIFAIQLGGVGRTVRDEARKYGPTVRLHVERWLRWSERYRLSAYAELGYARVDEVTELPLIGGVRMYAFGVFLGPLVGVNLIGGNEQVTTLGADWAPPVIVQEKQSTLKYALFGLQFGYMRGPLEVGYILQYEISPRGEQRSDHVAYPIHSTEFVGYVAWRI